MLLFVIPCGDAACNDKCTSTEAHDCGDEDQNHENKCSPFCICDCCSQNIQVLTEFNSIFDTINYSESVLNQTLLLFLPDFFEVKWQPPKLVEF